jgi:hypothetical protein
LLTVIDQGSSVVKPQGLKSFQVLSCHCYTCRFLIESDLRETKISLAS